MTTVLLRPKPPRCGLILELLSYGCLPEECGPNGKGAATQIPGQLNGSGFDLSPFRERLSARQCDNLPRQTLPRTRSGGVKPNALATIGHSTHAGAARIEIRTIIRRSNTT